MKFDDFRCRFVSMTVLVIGASSVGCGPVSNLSGSSQGEGGQAGASGLAGAGGEGGSSSSNSSGGAGGSGGMGGAGGMGGMGGSGGSGGCMDGQVQSCFTGDPQTLGVGVCQAGTETCVNGMFDACIGDVTATNEACNGLDDDCDGVIDNGNPGGGAACTSGMPGACSAGTMACTNGAMTCVANNSASPELCDGIDNDCDGVIDNGNPGGGAACTSGMPGACSAGTMACTNGAMTCVANNSASPEVCDGMDNDCDGVIDNGNPGGGAVCTSGMPGACSAGTMACTNGAMTCVANNSASPEVCDGMDNDCDGVIDNGNPGGGIACGPALGACTAQTTCMNGALSCLGTFVGPAGVGAPGNPGTQASPLSTIAAAQANAALVGNGADVCVCDTAAVGSSVYQENVTMIEGISILGGYNCADWSRDIATYVTTIQGPTPPMNVISGTAVDFPAGITSITALDGMTVLGPNVMPISGRTYSRGIVVKNSSPLLQDLIVTGGSADESIGLQISAVNGGTASPSVLRGTYGASAAFGATSLQEGVTLSGASGTFTDVTMTASGSGETSIGLYCLNCGATTITGGSISGGTSTKFVTGLQVKGNVAGFSVSNTNMTAGTGGLYGIAIGAMFDSCIGSPTITGGDINSGTTSQGYAYGVDAHGAQCTPIVSGSNIYGGSGSYCPTVLCHDNSKCNVTNSTIVGSANPSCMTTYGVHCITGGCGTFSENTIAAATISSIDKVAVGVNVSGANPTFDGNDVKGPACANGTKTGGTKLSAAYFTNSTSLLTNNVFREQPCIGPVDVVRFENASPTMHNNTIQFSTCSGCDVKRGLFVTGTTAAGSVRNNIFSNAGIADFTNGFAVYEKDATSDLAFFENNDIWAPNGGTLYFDEGTTSLTLASINALMGSGGNINADPLLDATFHIPMMSPCRNAGTATGAPAFDFDGDMRPQEMIYDIGADEYVP